jgi:VanZ family protein
LKTAVRTAPENFRLLSLWLPVVAYMGVIFYMSSLSSPPIPEEVSDKTLHFVFYSGLALVALRAVAGGRWEGVTLRTLVACWLIATLYGATDEWHQMFTEGRMPEFADVGADAFGAGLAAFAAGAWSIIRRL